MGMRELHVCPPDDPIEHECLGDECVCGPDMKFPEGGGVVVVHHSLDGREFHEEGK